MLKCIRYIINAVAVVVKVTGFMIDWETYMESRALELIQTGHTRGKIALKVV